MNREYEGKYHRLEERNFWFAGRRDMLVRMMKRLGVSRAHRVLEIGCSGGILISVLHELGFTSLLGIDLSEAAIRRCRTRGLENVVVMDGSRLGFGPSCIDCILASDVLEHIQDDDQALADWWRILRPGKPLLVFVPSYQFLWSEHDVANHHRRRYTRRALTDKLRNSGFAVEACGYWNSLFFFPVLAYCLWDRMASLIRSDRNGRHVSGDHLLELPDGINRVLLELLRFENRICNGRISLPFGVSNFAVARKPHDPPAEASGPQEKREVHVP